MLRLAVFLCAMTSVPSLFAQITMFWGSPFGEQSLVLQTPSGQVTIQANATGAWWSDGTRFTYPTEAAYTIACCAGPNDFFVFDLSGAPSTITGASLSIGNPNLVGNPYGLAVNIWDVTTPLASLTASSGSPDIFSDLGSGILFSSLPVGPAYDGTQVEFTLNSSAIDAIQAARGGQIAFGGSLDQIDYDAPEPNAIALAAGGLALAFWMKCRRFRTR